MADTTEVDAGLMTHLRNDATLATYASGGVWWDLAPAGLTHFVIVSQQDHEDVPVMAGSKAYEALIYLVKFVGAGASETESKAKSGASRIDALLEGQTFSATGYGIKPVRRMERVRYTEDEMSADAQQVVRRWQHRGGLYQVMAEAS